MVTDFWVEVTSVSETEPSFSVLSYLTIWNAKPRVPTSFWNKPLVCPTGSLDSLHLTCVHQLTSSLCLQWGTSLLMTWLLISVNLTTHSTSESLLYHHRSFSWTMLQCSEDIPRCPHTFRFYFNNLRYHICSLSHL